ncbi:MAG TPA: PAS domain-containing protein, partial [Gemmataceae bacterium]|nr:PAS domain-containing protein [Gemmataceae bacterium]
RCIRDAVISTDAQGCVRIFNHRAEQLTGWSQEQAWGKDLLNVFVIVNGETLTHSVTNSLQTRAAFDLAKHSSLVAKDGRNTPVEGNVTPVYDDRRCFLGFILTFREVMDRQGKP